MFTRSRGSVLASCASPKKEPEFTATDNGGGGGDCAGDDYACNIGIDTNGYFVYGSAEEDPESKVVDVYQEPELVDGDGNAIDINGYYDCDPPKDEPELVAVGDGTDADSGPDVGYDCPHCGISLCSREFKVEHELRCKVLTKQKELESQDTKLYHCRYCRCPFVNKAYKEQHQRRGCPKRPVAKKKPSNGPYFECDKCEFVTKYKASLERHFLTHNKDNAEWFTCTQCSYKTVCKRNLTKHEKIHDNTFSCCCPICGKGFRMKRYLDDHLLRHHSDESDEFSKLITHKFYTCNICDQYRTISKRDFNLHLTVKHYKGVGRQKYECPRCPYSTFSKGHLKQHSKTHAEQKDHCCTVCEKPFAHKQQLDSHILYIHADNVDLVKTITRKIHRCQSCFFQTVHKAKLTSHVRSKHI